jgi:hypothetical protein
MLSAWLILVVNYMGNQARYLRLTSTKRQKELDNRITSDIIVFTCDLTMTSPPPPDHPQKSEMLRRHGTLNPHPEAVAHPCFTTAISSTPTTWYRSSTRCCARFTSTRLRWKPFAAPKAKTRGRADRYSFLVRPFHPQLHAGLSRPTITFFPVTQ